MSTTITLKVKQVIEETADAVTLVFEKPAWTYLAGQFITLRIPFGDQYVERSYSFSSHPSGDDALAITVKRVPGGQVSTYLQKHAHEGLTLEAKPPAGQFTLPPLKHTYHHLVLLAGGSGITPLFSILKEALLTSEKTKISLIYANRHEEDIIYKEALAAWQARYPTRLLTTHILSRPSPLWQGYRGRLTPKRLHSLLQRIQDEGSPTTYFLCAPKGLMEMIRTSLAQRGVPPSHIFQESFIPPSLPAKQTPFTYDLKLHFEGQTYQTNAPNTQTVLEAALEAGAELPYACMSGTCNTCRAKCTKGSVEMSEDEGLSSQELEEGYILTCVAHAKSKQVEIIV
ncbi:MAG: ferredoxin--NADP reductase [Bacteroidota bacterium]